jgi:hypothetical protein
LLCVGCPFGWTAGKVGNKTHCYKAVSLNGTGQLNAAQWDTVCAQFNATAVSIESAAENNLTYRKLVLSD